MKMSEINELTLKEIQERVIEEEANLQDLRFTHALKQLTNTAKLSETKKTIARMKTVLRQRELEEAEQTNKGDEE